MGSIPITRSIPNAMERYRLGQSSYFEVRQEQQQLFPAEHTLVQTLLDQQVNLVQLCRALGGGWEISVKNLVEKVRLLLSDAPRPGGGS